ncbi:MAG: SusF/SusE family outer membrane protein [Leeuwenhoekiella sp.]
MKNIITKFLFFLAAVFFFAACEDDAELTTLATVSFTENPLVTPGSLVLTQEEAAQAAVTISWEAVSFPIEAPVAYSVQFDVVTDTIGDLAWANAVTLAAGSEVFSKSMIASELNDIANDLGLESDVEGTLVIRVQAYLDRTISSSAIAMNITPYTTVISNTNLYLPGSYSEWNAATADSISATATSGVFKGVLTLSDADKLDFKIALNKDSETIYGGDGNGNLILDGANLNLPAIGTYQINVDLNTLKWSATLYSWGIIGPATPQGWDADTNMFYDTANQVWKYVGYLQAGALKWRLNDDWATNYGPQNNDDGIAYLDDPGAYTVTASGVYEVSFKVNEDPATASYTINTVSWGIIGDATPGGWDADTDMTFNATSGFWEITVDLVPGSVKFRRDDAWPNNYGPRNNTDGILYYDDPGAHGVAEAGSYYITFTVDAANSALAYYTIEKQN